MRAFWALPCALRLIVAAQSNFNVYTDLLASPQYQVIYSTDSYVPEEEAQSILAEQERWNDEVTNEVLQGNVGNEQQIPVRDQGQSPARDTFERMSFEGVPYLCRIPHVAPTTTDGPANISPEEQQKELVRASDHGWKLLQEMQGNCLYYAGGWWVYSFCYNDGIKQFHPLPPGKGGTPLFPPQEDKAIGSYVLGKFETTPPATRDSKAEADGTEVSASTELQTRGETNYLVRKLEGGTICDLTGRPRRVEVQFHCNPSTSDRINMIKETSSCVYLMIIHTPLLCNDVAFLPPQTEKANQITCQEIVMANDVENWKQWKEETVDRQRELQKHAGSDPLQGKPLVIGGIEVGAHKLVGGSPERTIKASKIVSNAEKSSEGDKFVAQLAHSDGNRVIFMSDKEIEKLGLKAAKDRVDEYRKQIRQLAGNGVPWSLDLYTTPGGWEIRMVIGAEDGDRPSKKGDADDGDGDEYDDDDNAGGSDEEYL